jgi:hypothetical protein
MMKKALLALAIAGAMTTAQATEIVNEGFNDVRTLAARGWTLTNASTPAGIGGLLQGNADAFTAQAGANNSFLSASYLSAAEGGTINDWIITPEFSALYGATVTFWLRGEIFQNYIDTITYGFNDGSTTLSSLVQSQVATATDTWTQITATIAAGTASTHFAINYAGAFDAINYIGIDSLVINVNDATGEVPEPASLAILAAGLIGMGAARRRKQRAMAA